jgi:hypothetical protein
VALQARLQATADLPRAPPRKCGTDQRKGLTENDYARLLDAARQQLAGPLVPERDNLNSHVSDAMDRLIAPRDWLTACRLPQYANELNLVEAAWICCRGRLAGWRAPDAEG